MDRKDRLQRPHECETAAHVSSLLQTPSHHVITAKLSRQVSRYMLVELSKVYRPTKQIIGHIGGGFLRVKRANQLCRSTEGR